MLLLFVVSGPVKEEDILVLPLDILKFDSHANAVSTVLKHFGQVCFFNQSKTKTTASF